MALNETTVHLRRLRNKYSEQVFNLLREVKPLFDNEPGQRGNAYEGIEAQDRDYIYEMAGELNEYIQRPNSPISFDISHFVTEAKALRSLKKLAVTIAETTKELKQIKDKYADRKCAHYPINTT